MKTLIIFAALAASGFAQTLSLTCPSGPVKTGSTLSIPVVLAGSGGGFTGIQYTVTTTPALGAMTATSTGVASSASKGIYISGSSVVQGGYGPPIPGTLNTNLIPNGTIATLSWTVPTTLANQTVTITLAGGALPLSATGASASFNGVSPGPSCAVVTSGSTNLCDLNGDGVVSQADVTAELTRVLTFPQPANCARDANGCWVGAVQIIINAALGGSCTATQ